MSDDLTLLREYSRSNSEAAFAALVSRYVNLVYSVALRQVRDPQLAEEITQAVFIILARKAGSLGKKTILSGWLCRTARYASANALTIQRRRHRREQEAHMQTILNQPANDKTWIQIAPLLDTAMEKLGQKDHDALVLRFFENRNFKEVAVALGASEDAAKMRVSRALEKLRKFFTKRGVSSTTTIIAGAISANSIQAAPALLAKSVTAVAIVKGAAASGSTLALIQGALKLMVWAKAKMAIVTGACVLLAVGTATVVVKTNQSNDGLGAVLADMVNVAFADALTFPKLTNNVPEGGDLKVRSLLLWVQDDLRKNPGKSFHQVSYSIVIGTGEGTGEWNVDTSKRDLGMPYLLHYGNRSALVTLTVRPNFSASKHAFVVVTYYGGGQFLSRKITLQGFYSYRSQKWSVLRESGPAPDDVR